MADKAATNLRSMIRSKEPHVRLSRGLTTEHLDKLAIEVRKAKGLAAIREFHASHKKGKSKPESEDVRKTKEQHLVQHSILAVLEQFDAVSRGLRLHSDHFPDLMVTKDAKKHVPIETWLVKHRLLDLRPVSKGQSVKLTIFTKPSGQDMGSGMFASLRDTRTVSNKLVETVLPIKHFRNKRTREFVPVVRAGTVMRGQMDFLSTYESTLLQPVNDLLLELQGLEFYKVSAEMHSIVDKGKVTGEYCTIYVGRHSI